MIPRPGSRPRRLAAALRLGAVAALLLVAPVLLPSGSPSPTKPAGRPPPRPPRRAPSPPSTLEGTLDILHEDRDDGSSLYHHALALDDGTRVALDGVPPGRDLLTGDRVRVTGTRSATALRLHPSTPDGLAALQVLAPAPLANTFGVQKTLLILVNFANNPAQPYTVAQALTGYAALDAWFREVSYQQTSLAIDVVGWYTLPLTSAACDIALLQSKARQAATAAGVNLAPYVRQVYAFPFNATCPFAGMASVGGAPSSVWINGNTNTGLLAHEFGHTLGLYHSHALDCHPVRPRPRPAPSSTTAMPPTSWAAATGHYNAFQKQRLGWLDYNVSPPITTVSDQRHLPPRRLRAARHRPQSPHHRPRHHRPGLLRRVPPPPGLGCHPLSHRRLHPPRRRHPARQQHPPRHDPRPPSPLSDDAFLDVGQRFTDPVSGITLTTLSVSSTAATIQVDLDPSTPCIRSAPRVTATPAQSPAVLPGTAVTYTVSVTNTDTAGCAATTFALQATPPTTSWPKTFGAASLTPNPGETASTTLRITSPVVPPGAYPIAIAATSTTDSHALRLDLGALHRRPGWPPPLQPRADVHGHLRSARFARCWTMAGR